MSGDGRAPRALAEPVIRRRPSSCAGVPARLKVLVAASLLGRFHSTASNLVVGLAVQAWTGSFGLSGIVIGALALGNGLSAPVRGRAVDRAAVLTISTCGLAYGAGLAGLAVLTAETDPHRWPVAVVVALVSGVALPPVAPAVRSVLPELTTSAAETERVLTWEAGCQELIFIIGPPSLVAVVAWAGPAWALVVVAGLAVLGAGVFAVVLRRAVGHGGPRSRPASPAMGRTGAEAASPLDVEPLPRTVLARLSVAYGLILASLTAMTLVGVTVAVDAARPLLAGWLEAAVAAGSLVGGLLATRGLLDRWRLGARVSAMSLSLWSLVWITHTSAPPGVVAVALAVAGFWVAPSLALHAVAVLRAAPVRRRAEAFGYVNAAGLATNAVTTPVVGLVLDHAGAPGGAALAAVVLLVSRAAVAGLPDE